MKKTVVQELIDFIENQQLESCNKIKTKAIELLEKEKEEIIEAIMSARLEFSNSILTKPKVCKLSEQYYQKNFK